MSAVVVMNNCSAVVIVLTYVVTVIFYADLHCCLLRCGSVYVSFLQIFCFYIISYLKLDNMSLEMIPPRGKLS